MAKNKLHKEGTADIPIEQRLIMEGQQIQDKHSK